MERWRATVTFNEVVSIKSAQDRQLINMLSSNPTRAAANDIVTSTGIGLLARFLGTPIGSVAAGATLLFNIATNHATSHVTGSMDHGSISLGHLMNFLESRRYIAAEVEFAAFRVNGARFVAGNSDNPAAGYLMHRVQLSNGTWVDA